MSGKAFDGVAGDYGAKSLVQSAAADRLIGLLDPRHGESILDVGCGPGHITRRLADITSGRVVGTDISGGMIREAAASFPGIEFRRLAAEDLDYDKEFDVVFCNSTMQWFVDPAKAMGAMCGALLPGGRAGLCCPATPDFAPLFSSIVETVARRPEIAPFYRHRHNPWWHLPDVRAYREFFERAGFRTTFIGLEHEVGEYTVDQAFGVFTTGAARGFIGPEYYDVELTDGYLEAFNAAVREEMERRSISGLINVDFNRLYYTATPQ